ncbi:MAG: SDR family NAD(P)-dependent oxidoreductase [Polyangiales bacterium]
MSRPVVLITGASSGIGEALAREYGRRKFDVVVVARREDRLKSLVEDLRRSGVEALAVAGDVTVDGSIDAAVEAAVKRFGRLDVAIANAGISVAGSLNELTLDDHRRVFETNVFGALRTATACFEPLRASKGCFAVVGSVMGFVSLPRSGTYAASKHAVRAYAEALRHEWAPFGISVTHIAPGFVASEIRQVGNDGTHHPDRKDPIPAWIIMTAKAAAKEIADGLAKRKREVVVTGHGKAIAAIAEHAPELVRTVVGLAGSRIPRKEA